MYTIDPGEFKHPIEIQELQAVKVNNIASEKWVSILEAKAKIANISGREIQTSDSINAEYSKRFIIRYPTGLNIDTEDSKRYRIFYKNRGYDITYLSDIKDLNKYLEIVVKRIK
ncbi:head-tail adaptor [Clostridium sp. DSM 8431]|uniref:head-tail adaptor protein n=1 Tax=Clostridium sp. DSM 8431 TaxID=1761781 RepID=UPI0008E2105C|nr:head-tail adaptor protein [Clostridium sp. DSM 8431]SFU42825.1 head-tail adaptor [Clostridium sp. DSM 8431]